jgi:hypothetical protein
MLNDSEDPIGEILVSRDWFFQIAKLKVGMAIDQGRQDAMRAEIDGRRGSLIGNRYNTVVTNLNGAACDRRAIASPDPISSKGKVLIHAFDC